MVMLELTDAAKTQLHKSLAATPMTEREGKCFRIVPTQDKHLTIRLARPAPSDSTFRHKGAVVLALPKALRRFVKDKSLDIDNSGKLVLD